MDKQPMDKELEKDLKKYEDTKYDSLIQQINAEYSMSWLHQFNKIEQNLSRLKLYNNQRRDEDVIGDPLLFTVHQTLLASLYDDDLMVNFQGREEGDNDTAENLNDLAEFDYEKMGKDVHDYMLDWDTLFFGRGLTLMIEFDRSKNMMCPVPEVLDPMTWLRDPKATSVNGDMRGRGGMRFGGRELWIPKRTITEANGYMDTKYLRSDNEIRSLLKKASDERDAAQNLQNIFNKDVETNLFENSVTACLQWFTYWKGKRVMAILANSRTRLIKYYELPEFNQKNNRWGIIDRPLYPHSHDWAGTSVPDLIEDKQRQRAVLLNLGLNAVKSDLYPHYLYDEDRIKNKGDLINFGFNKFTGVANNEGKDIKGAVAPLNKATVRMDFVNLILETLDASVQRATATPDMQQGQVSAEKRTLGELNLVASKVDTRYSLTAKVFGWSEKEFWRQWYGLYKEHFTDGIDEKVIRISGSTGSKWRPLKREDIISIIDPDVTIESKVLSEAKQLKERLLLQGYGQLLLADPDANKRFYLKLLGKKSGFKRDEIELLLPPTSQELLAEDENDSLSKNKMIEVKVTDDHKVHLEINGKAAETAAKAAHIHAHKLAMEMVRQNPSLAPQSVVPVDNAGNPVLPGEVPAPQNPSTILGNTPSKVASPQTA